MAELENIGAAPTVSIIIATYNRGNFMAKAIESVLAQTFQDFELIIIDDGSTDGTSEVVAQFQDPRITYKWLEHGERSRARNLGIQLGRGRYIAFLDSDDWYLPHKLAVQIAALEANPEAGLVLGGWLIVDETGRKIQEVRPWAGISPQPTLEEWLFSATATPITVMVKKEWLERVGGFDPKLFMSEDVELWIRLTLAGCSVVWTKENVAVVLAHGTNSLRDWPSARRGRLDFLNKIFSNPNFNQKLRMSQQEVLAGFHLALAWQAYEAGLPEQGGQELVRAVELNPKLLERNGEALLISMIDHSQYFLVANPITFVERVFQNLPAPLAHLSRYRREVLAKTWLSQAWRVHRDGELALVRRSIFHAMWHTPSCLRNRGILSMLFQSLIGQHLWRMTQSVLHWMVWRWRSNEY